MTAESKPRFLDSLIGLFRDKPGEAPPTNPNKDRDFEAQRANFDAALHDLDEKAEEHRRAPALASWIVCFEEIRGREPETIKHMSCSFSRADGRLDEGEGGWRERRALTTRACQSPGSTR